MRILCILKSISFFLGIVEDSRADIEFSVIFKTGETFIRKWLKDI